MTTSQSKNTSRQLRVILENAPDCEFDHAVINIPESDDPDEDINLAIHEAIENWRLSPGDTIKIVEES